MNSKEYIEACKRTENIEQFKSFAKFTPNIRLLHAALGVATESAEFADIMKKHLFYGKTFDVLHAKKELGDILWYIAVACDVLGTDFEALMELNIEKLKARYPERFTTEQAITRKEGDI